MARLRGEHSAMFATIASAIAPCLTIIFMIMEFVTRFHFPNVYPFIHDFMSRGVVTVTEMYHQIHSLISAAIDFIVFMTNGRDESLIMRRSMVVLECIVFPAPPSSPHDFIALLVSYNDATAEPLVDRRIFEVEDLRIRRNFMEFDSIIIEEEQQDEGDDFMRHDDSDDSDYDTMDDSTNETEDVTLSVGSSELVGGESDIEDEEDDESENEMNGLVINLQ